MQVEKESGEKYFFAMVSLISKTVSSKNHTIMALFYKKVKTLT